MPPTNASATCKSTTCSPPHTARTSCTATLDGDSSKIRLDAHAREHLQPLLAFWQKYRSLLPAAGQTQTHNQNQLRQLNEYAHSVQIQRDEALQKLRTALLRDSRRAASVSRMLHLLGALIIAAGLVLSVLHFVKQWKVDRKLEAARLETDEILDTLSEGLFLLDKDMIIGTQQSKMLGTLLPQIGEGGQNFMDLAAEILPDRRKLSSVKMFIEQLYNPRVVERLIYGLNPLRKVEVPLKRGSDERHVLGFHFTRVIKDRQIVKVLVSVRDLTDTVRIESRLQREQEQNDLQIEMISRMLNADEVIMRSFLHTSLKQLAQINTILKNPGNHAEDLRNKARLISQEIHAFKGEASVLNMSAFVLAAEAFEDIIQQLRQKRPLTGNDFLPLVVELESLLEKVAQYRRAAPQNHGAPEQPRRPAHRRHRHRLGHTVRAFRGQYGLPPQQERDYGNGRAGIPETGIPHLPRRQRHHHSGVAQRGGTRHRTRARAHAQRQAQRRAHPLERYAGGKQAAYFD
nr:Hpt domain-containing protein [Conchiformibius kuhniae]